MGGYLPSLGWSPTNPRMAIQQEGTILQNQNLALTLNFICFIFYFQLVWTSSLQKEVVGLAQLVSPSVALQAKLVFPDFLTVTVLSAYELQLTKEWLEPIIVTRPTHLTSIDFSKFDHMAQMQLLKRVFGMVYNVATFVAVIKFRMISNLTPTAWKP